MDRTTNILVDNQRRAHSLFLLNLKEMDLKEAGAARAQVLNRVGDVPLKKAGPPFFEYLYFARDVHLDLAFGTKNELSSALLLDHPRKASCLTELSKIVVDATKGIWEHSAQGHHTLDLFSDGHFRLGLGLDLFGRGGGEFINRNRERMGERFDCVDGRFTASRFDVINRRFRQSRNLGKLLLTEVLCFSQKPQIARNSFGCRYESHSRDELNGLPQN